MYICKYACIITSTLTTEYRVYGSCGTAKKGIEVGTPNHAAPHRKQLLDKMYTKNIGLHLVKQSSNRKINQ